MLSLAWILLAAALVPPAYCLATYLLAHATSKAPFRRGSPSLSARALVRESLLQYQVFAHIPLDLLRSEWSSREGNGGLAVILLPGYAETDFIFERLRRRLAREELAYFTFRCRPALGELRAQSRRLVELVDRLAGRYRRICLVGHSMGGLVGRCALARAPSIAELICVATPHRGTVVAHFGLGPCARQLVPGNALLRELRQEEGRGEVRLANVCSSHDSLIAPRESAFLPGLAPERQLVVASGWGHNGVLGCPQTVDFVLARLRAQRAPAAQGT